MIKIEEMQERIKSDPDRRDVKTCLRESYSLVRGGDALLSIRYLLLGIYGILKIRDLTKPELKFFSEDVLKNVSGIDLMPIVKEATEGKISLSNTLEDKGMKDLFGRLQSITSEIKKIEKRASEDKAVRKKEEIKEVFAAIDKELGKGNVAAAKAKADRLLEKYHKKKVPFLEKIIHIFEENESLKGWWHYFQKCYDPKKLTLEEAKYCAAKVSKMRSLDDPEKATGWYRNTFDYRLRVWELIINEENVETESIIEACYNFAICVYYCREEIDGMVPKIYGRKLIEEGLRFAPDSPHLKKMGKTFGVHV